MYTYNDQYVYIERGYLYLKKKLVEHFNNYSHINSHTMISSNNNNM